MTWAIDLGTTNTGLARWDAAADAPRLVELPAICRRPGRVDPLEAPRLVPSAVHVLPGKDFWTRVGRWPVFAQRFYWGQQALIGRAALEANQGVSAPAFCPSFKGALSRAPTRSLARLRGDTFDARQIARLFLRELFAEADRVTGDAVRDLVVTTPVHAFETYRLEVKRAAEAAGVRRVRFLDEPVAAALGYGLGLDTPRRVLVVDFGGGTLDLAVVALQPRAVEAGTGEVVAKEGRPVGGNLVDEWLLDDIATRLGVRLDGLGTEVAMWRRLMLDETRRVKEAVYFEPQATFTVTPGEDEPAVAARLRDRPRYLDLRREDVVATLEAHDLYPILEDCCASIEAQLKAIGLDASALDEVLMVGGSTLLPGVYGVFEKRYGRDRVRAWQPFEAVAWGAAAFASGRIGQNDFLVHDYALVTFDARSHEKQHLTVVPRGTRFPTAPDFWTRRFVPTCSLGEPESLFQLVVAEVSAAGGDRRFAWDAEGNVRRVGGEVPDAPVVVPLNAANPTLGRLDPPHAPGDRTPRLEIKFGVDENRWLVATVIDLRLQKVLMKENPVVRLM